MVNFDTLANQAVLDAFGEQAQTGTGVSYTPQGGQPFTLDGVFDEAWREIGFHTSRHAVGLPVSTTKPAFGCRFAAFPAANPPKQGDTLVRYRTLLQENGQPLLDEDGDPIIEEDNYTVSDVRPDGISGWVLLILK